MIALSELELDLRDQFGLLSVQELRTFLRQWDEADGHHIREYAHGLLLARYAWDSRMRMKWGH
jgi:hypothetical protein